MSEVIMRGKSRPRQRDKMLLGGGGSTDMVAMGGEESVNVCVRVRPFNRREEELHRRTDPDEFLRSVVEMPDGLAGHLRMLERDPHTGDYACVEDFHFTYSFWSVSEEQQGGKYLPIGQEDVFDVVGKVVLRNAINGFNSCIFAYGQTGSGKTHTMMGDFHTTGGEFTGDPGLIPRMCRELFRLTEQKKEEMERENARLRVSFDIKLSAMEIYNEQVRDLFWKGSPFAGRTKQTLLKIRVHPTKGAFVDQLTVFNPRNWEECIKLIAAGVSERTVAATLMNDESSRSHSVFQITIEITESLGPPPDDPARRFDKPVVKTKSSLINLVDLAGSERNKKSGAVGQQLKEAAGINLSLTTLKRVIDALVNNGTEKSPKKHIIVPYRESALTQLLSHSLGGNSKTTMIACVSPHFDNQDETLNTLRYANRTKGIVNHVKANEDDAQRQALLLREQILELQKKICEGPQTYTPEQLDDLRDQIDVGQRYLKGMEEENAKKEQEATKMSEMYHTQKDARYAATYYNSFKRVMLTRLRDESERMIKELESQLQVAEIERERLTHTLSERERSNRESQYSIEELRRRNELWLIKSARNEAMSRELVREIVKLRKRSEEHLTSRYGLRWVRNKQERQLTMTLEQQKDAIRKDHEQYLQSIVREARKQYETLVSTFSDKEYQQQERLETMERGRMHAAGQLEKIEHMQASLSATLQQSSEEQKRREKDKDAAWERRYESMKQIYEEKIEQLLQRKFDFDAAKEGKIAKISSNSRAQNVMKIDELDLQLRGIQSDGERRLQEITHDTDTQIAEALERMEEDHVQSAETLAQRFAADKTTLIEKIERAESELTNGRDRLGKLYHFGLQLEDSAKHAQFALQNDTEPKQGDPPDLQRTRRAFQRFVDAYAAQPIEFIKISSCLRKKVPPPPADYAERQ